MKTLALCIVGSCFALATVSILFGSDINGIAVKVSIVTVLMELASAIFITYFIKEMWTKQKIEFHEIWTCVVAVVVAFFAFCYLGEKIPENIEIGATVIALLVGFVHGFLDWKLNHKTNETKTGREPLL